jgi:hypothetical protein
MLTGLEYRKLKQKAEKDALFGEHAVEVSASHQHMADLCKDGMSAQTEEVPKKRSKKVAKSKSPAVGAAAEPQIDKPERVSVTAIEPLTTAVRSLVLLP